MAVSSGEAPTAHLAQNEDSAKPISHICACNLVSFAVVQHHMHAINTLLHKHILRKGQIPALRNQIPALRNQIPALRNQIPALRNQIPALTIVSK
jgi:hypothetical protein